MKTVFGGFLIFALGYCVGIFQGSTSANIKSYAIGYDQGYSTGISDAAMAYKSGGIVDGKTGEVIKDD